MVLGLPCSTLIFRRRFANLPRSLMPSSRTHRLSAHEKLGSITETMRAYINCVLHGSPRDFLPKVHTSFETGSFDWGGRI